MQLTNFSFVLALQKTSREASRLCPDIERRFIFPQTRVLEIRLLDTGSDFPQPVTTEKSNLLIFGCAVYYTCGIKVA